MSAEGEASLVGGRYRIEATLGRGGMGAVFRVRDERTGAGLALKRVSSTSASAERHRALFEREYHTLAQLAHPRIIEVYDYGIDDDGAYYTMELLDGADLRTCGRLPWREACSLLRDVASSLAILHSRRMLHRDVSARNVRCTADGRAKLIDFGAMVPMGVAKDVVGTPPFVAPESLQLQTLDARADLFSLGALSYWVLTGRHAYPCRKLSLLRDAWRSEPVPPRRLVPDIPPALSALVAQLLSLDRSARPQSAAEVMERLAAIADLPREEHVEVTRAYLATPTLVGRTELLTQLRLRVILLARLEGSCVLVEGEPGTGRSRFLDACVLEGKLLGTTVLRADASDALYDFGVLQQLARQLLLSLPKEANGAARLQRGVLVHAVPELALEHAGPAPDTPPPERARLLRELRDWILAVASTQRLLIVVDDYDAIDEPSAALLAALAHKGKKSALMLVLSATRSSAAPDAPALHLVRELAQRVQLPPLSADQTVALVRSLFGDVANLQVVAGRVHELSSGNPRAAMELAQHLVDRGLACYRAGSWALPDHLDDRDLPASLSEALARRLSQLTPSALRLAQALALSDGAALVLSDYLALWPDAEGKELYRELDELVAAGVLSVDAERYRFTQRGYLPLLVDAVEPERKRAMHENVAEILRARGSDPVALSHHLLHAGRVNDAVAELTALHRVGGWPPLKLLVEAHAASQHKPLPARLRHELEQAILGCAPSELALETFNRHLPSVLDQLERDSGLRAYKELDPALPSAERLQRALALTQQRYDDAAEDERVYSVVEAITELARLTAAFLAMGMIAYDLEYVEGLPDLTPLTPLSRALLGMNRAVEASKAFLMGRALEGKRLYEALLDAVNQPDRHGFEPPQQALMILSIHYLLGLADATMGLGDSAEQHARALENDPAHRISAFRVRVAMHLTQGNAEEARRCQRRAELLQIQSGQRQRYVGSSAAVELVARAMAGDLIGVKSSLAAVKLLAPRYRGWRQAAHLGEAYYGYLQGDLEGALEVLARALEETRPGRHVYWGYLAALQVRLLSELGRWDEAVSRGADYLDACREHRLATVGRWVKVEQGLALARAGRHEEARALSDEAVQDAVQLGTSGLPLGAVYEARARIALIQRDELAFEHYSRCCAAEYKKGRDPMLSAKYLKLLEEARPTRLGENLPVPGPAHETLEYSQTASALQTIHSRLLECTDAVERGHCALAMLLEHSACESGHLFALRGERLWPVASLPSEVSDDAAAPELTAWLWQCLQLEIEPERSATLDEADEAESRRALPTRLRGGSGRRYECIFLVGDHEGQQLIAGVLALEFPLGPKTVPSGELLREIAGQMLRYGDASGVPVA